MKLKLTILCFMLLFTACSDDDTFVPLACAKVDCTLELVTINVRVQDPDGVNIPLDDFKVTDKISREHLTAAFTPQELEQFRQSGTYPLYDDRFVPGNQNKKRDIVFAGYINGKNEVSRMFVVQADCCHVSLFSGNTLIILD